MSNINTVVISGRATRDPELRHLPSGDPVANFGIANERYNKNDPENPYVGFYEVTVFGKFGELVAGKLRKGEKVTVDGRLDFSSWETEDGQKRSKVGIVANQVEGEFIYKKADEVEASTAQTTTDAAPAADAADDDIPF